MLVGIVRMILSTSTGRIKGWKLGFVKTSTGRIKGWKTGFVKMEEKMKNWKWKIEYQKWENEKFSTNRVVKMKEHLPFCREFSTVFIEDRVAIDHVV